jgi:hypothetical protein
MFSPDALIARETNSIEIARTSFGRSSRTKNDSIIARLVSGGETARGLARRWSTTRAPVVDELTGNPIISHETVASLFLSRTRQNCPDRGDPQR